MGAPPGAGPGPSLSGGAPKREGRGPAAEAAPMFLEHQVDPRQQAPEAVSPIGVIRGMNRVLWKRNRVLDFGWRGRNADVDLERAQPIHQFPIKLRNRPGA